MNKNQKIIMWVGSIVLMPLSVIWLFSLSNYFSVKNQQQIIVSESLGEELDDDNRHISDWSSQERTEYFRRIPKEDTRLLDSLQAQEHHSMGWIAVTGVLICFGGGFAALAFFLAGIPRIKNNGTWYCKGG